MRNEISFLFNALIVACYLMNFSVLIREKGHSNLKIAYFKCKMKLANTKAVKVNRQKAESGDFKVWLDA
jgi:hypothetical protein